MLPGFQLDRGKQATHSAHVTIAVAPDLIRDTLERHQPVLEWVEGRENPLQLQVGPGLFRPKFPRHRPVRREHENDALHRRALCRAQPV
jgi:hypothetical protein